MQEESGRRSNPQRTAATRKALMAAARKLFTAKGYGETGTPEIVAAAKVTRGALYHHFADKADLFRAVVAAEAEAVAARIARESSQPASALDALTAGTEAYFAAMAAPGRARLLLVEGPAVLEQGDMERIGRETGSAELRQGLAQAMAEGTLREAPLDALTALLSAAFDHAALAIAKGGPAEDYKAAIRLMLGALVAKA